MVRGMATQEAPRGKPKCRACGDSGMVTHHARGCDVEEEPATPDDHPARVYDCRSCNAAHECRDCGDQLADDAACGGRICLSCVAREALAASLESPCPLVLSTSALVTAALLRTMRAPRSDLAKAGDRQRQLIAATRAGAV